MVQELSISERRACRYAGLSRTSYREPPSMNESTANLSTRIVELAHERRRFGYRRIHDLLALEGRQVNHKRVWRLYKLANLSVRKRRKVKRPTGERQPLAASQHVNDTWSADFVMDALANGRRIKCPTVVDDFSRECVDIAVDHGIGGEYVVCLLDQAAQFRGYPLAIRIDQGPEFTSRAFMAWAAARGVRHLLNDAGCPTQNAYIESFNGKLRDECLNEQWFETLVQARQEVARWRRDYNEVRPHSSLGRIPPASFAALHRQRAGDARQSPEIK
ncbi:MAG: transposase [Alicycliphilus sp. 69-12]|nr:MAG: transposase [Alicycliphilus sp. 69-12]